MWVLIAVRGRDKIPANLNALAFETDADLEGADEVVTIGFGQGQGDWAVLKGQVISVDGRDVKIDGRIEEGNSGGPVLKDGKVVALITSSQRGLGLATPAQFVKFVLKSWGVDVTRVTAATPAATGGQTPKTGTRPGSHGSLTGAGQRGGDRGRSRPALRRDCTGRDPIP